MGIHSQECQRRPHLLGSHVVINIIQPALLAFHVNHKASTSSFSRIYWNSSIHVTRPTRNYQRLGQDAPIVERNGTTHDDFLGFERHSEVLDASTYANQPKQHNIYMDNTYQSDIETTATVVREHTVAFRFVKYLRHRA